MKKFLFTPKHLAISQLFTLPLYSHIANSSTTCESNLVTGKNGIATGYNAVTATNGLRKIIIGGNTTSEKFNGIKSELTNYC